MIQKLLDQFELYSCLPFIDPFALLKKNEFNSNSITPLLASNSITVRLSRLKNRHDIYIWCGVLVWGWYWHHLVFIIACCDQKPDPLNVDIPSGYTPDIRSGVGDNSDAKSWIPSGLSVCPSISWSEFGAHLLSTGAELIKLKLFHTGFLKIKEYFLFLNFSETGAGKS